MQFRLCSVWAVASLNGNSQATTVTILATTTAPDNHARQGPLSTPGWFSAWPIETQNPIGRVSDQRFELRLCSDSRNFRRARIVSRMESMLALSAASIESDW